MIVNICGINAVRLSNIGAAPQTPPSFSEEKEAKRL